MIWAASGESAWQTVRRFPQLTVTTIRQNNSVLAGMLRILRFEASLGKLTPTICLQPWTL